MPKIVRRVPSSSSQKIVRRQPANQSVKPVKKKPTRPINKKPNWVNLVKKSDQPANWINFVVLGLILAGVMSWIIEQLNDPLTVSYLRLLSFTSVVSVKVVSMAIAIIAVTLAVFRRFNWLPLLLPLVSYILSIQNRQTNAIYLTFWVLASVLICEYYFPKYLEVFFGIGLVMLLFFKVWLGAIVIVLVYLWNRFYVVKHQQ